MTFKFWVFGIILTKSIYFFDISYFGTKEIKCYNVLRIGLKANTKAELAAKKQLERIISIYPISQWIFTDSIFIDETAIPHSHPVLTLNTKYLADDTAQLSTFLHEQFHWFVLDKMAKHDSAILAFEKEYPSVPEKLPFGARGSYSTYLHLIVCDLEYQAMTKIIGKEKAFQFLQNWKHYTWIYDKVMKDENVRKINIQLGFKL